MNNRFQGCCLLRPFALKTPSFSSSKRSSLSRASVIVYENRSDIVVLRRPNSSWRDDDDNSVEDYLSQVTKSSLDVHIGSLRSVSDNKNMRRKFRDEMALGQCVSNGSNDRISKWVSNSANQGKGSEYNLEKKKLQCSSKFLDLLTMCFWKCSPGCQEVPELNSVDDLMTNF